PSCSPVAPAAERDPGIICSLQAVLNAGFLAGCRRRTKSAFQQPLEKLAVGRVVPFDRADPLCDDGAGPIDDEGFRNLARPVDALDPARGIMPDGEGEVELVRESPEISALVSEAIEEAGLRVNADRHHLETRGAEL